MYEFLAHCCSVCECQCRLRRTSKGTSTSTVLVVCEQADGAAATVHAAPPAVRYVQLRHSVHAVRQEAAAMADGQVTLEVAYPLVQRFEQFVVSIQNYYELFSWEEAPLHDVVYPLSTGVVYTLLVLLWSTCREKPYPPGSAEAKHVAMEQKQTDQALKPFVGAPLHAQSFGALASCDTCRRRRVYGVLTRPVTSGPRSNSQLESMRWVARHDGGDDL